MFGTGYTVTPNGTDFAFGSHHVGNHQQVAYVHLKSGTVKRELQFVHDGLPCGFDAEVIVNLDDVVGVGA